MANLFEGLSKEKLAELVVQHPQYKELAEAELARRAEVEAKAEADLLAQLAKDEALMKVGTDVVKAIAKVYPNGFPEGLTNIIVYSEIPKDANGNVLEGAKAELKAKPNVGWNEKGLDKPKREGAKSRSVTVTKFDSNNIKVWEYGFENGEKASEYLNIPKNASGAPYRIEHFKSDDGSWYKVASGVNPDVVMKG